jgi:hypothetical protein
MKEHVESLGWVRLQGILLLIAAFVIGGVVGIMIDRAGSWRGHRPRFDRVEKRIDRPGEMPRFFQDLALTAEQEAQIRAIFDAHRPVIDSLLSATMPQIRALRDSAEVQIVALLTPEQKAKYDNLKPRQRFLWGGLRRPFDSSRFDGPPPDGPGPDGPPPVEPR